MYVIYHFQTKVFTKTSKINRASRVKVEVHKKTQLCRRHSRIRELAVIYICAIDLHRACVVSVVSMFQCLTSINGYHIGILYSIWNLQIVFVYS